MMGNSLLSGKWAELPSSECSPCTSRGCWRAANRLPLRLRCGDCRSGCWGLSRAQVGRPKAQAQGSTEAGRGMWSMLPGCDVRLWVVVLTWWPPVSPTHWPEIAEPLGCWQEGDHPRGQDHTVTGQMCHCCPRIHFIFKDSCTEACFALHRMSHSVCEMFGGPGPHTGQSPGLSCPISPLEKPLAVSLHSQLR